MTQFSKPNTPVTMMRRMRSGTRLYVGKSDMIVKGHHPSKSEYLVFLLVSKDPHPSGVRLYARRLVGSLFFLTVMLVTGP
jgi:hypothetical protein